MLSMATESRLGALEARVTWLRRATGLLSIIAAAPWLFALGTPKSVSNELDARTLTIRDERGRIAATLDERGLHLLSSSGKVRVVLSGGAEWAALGLFDQAEKLRAHLTIGEDGHASLLIKDATEHNRVILGAPDPGLPKSARSGPAFAVTLLDASGGQVARLP